MWPPPAAYDVRLPRQRTQAVRLSHRSRRRHRQSDEAGEINAKKRTGHYSVVPYQTTHNTGGAAMGGDPKTSFVNKYLQSWDVPNLFVMGSAVFPQNAGYNPTGTVGALVFHAAKAVREQYLRAPGPLVQA